MSSTPSGFTSPKTNWTSADVVTPNDLNIIGQAVNAIEQGSRTLDPAQAPTGNVGTLRQLLDWFANRIKAITGKTNWYDAPDTTLAAAKTHIDNTTTAHGGIDATSILTKLKTVDGAGSGLDADLIDGCHAGNSANNVLKLDSNGRVPNNNLPFRFLEVASTFVTIPANSHAQIELNESRGPYIFRVYGNNLSKPYVAQTGAAQTNVSENVFAYIKLADAFGGKDLLIIVNKTSEQQTFWYSVWQIVFP